jgi:hypothetical protein
VTYQSMRQRTNVFGGTICTTAGRTENHTRLLTRRTTMSARICSGTVFRSVVQMTMRRTGISESDFGSVVGVSHRGIVLVQDNTHQWKLRDAAHRLFDVPFPTTISTQSMRGRMASTSSTESTGGKSTTTTRSE